MSREIEKLAAMLHTLSCDKPHTELIDVGEMQNPYSCRFYLEELLAPSEPRPEHEAWETYASDLCEKVELSPTDLIRELVNLLDLRRRLDTILVRSPTLEAIAHQILFDGSSREWSPGGRSSVGASQDSEA